MSTLARNDSAESAISTDPLFSFEIPRGVLRAMALFQAGGDRAALCVTSHEIVKKASGHHELTFAATNGRILASYNTEILSESLFGEMPNELVMSCDLSGIKKLPKNGGADLVTVAVFPTHVEYSSGSLQYTAKRIEGEHVFPAWRACIPTGKPEPAEFFVASAKYLKAFGDAAKLISDDLAIAIQSYGKERPIIIQIPDDTGFFGVLMPMNDVEWQERPDWLIEKKSDAATAAKNGGVE